MKETILVLGLVLGPNASALEVREYFPRQAMGAVDVGLPLSHAPANSQCIGCHQQEFADWSKTRHAAAYSNQNFLEGYFREPQVRCLNCHAPLKEQVQEIQHSPQLKLAHEGVNCIACHVRDGVVQSSGKTGESYHSFVKNDFLKSPQFCASCHEFNVNSNHDGKIALTNTNAQSTYSEWLQYQAQGGVRTCQGCHMPEGRHYFQGAHERKGSPLTVRVYRSGKNTQLELAAHEVGHNFPTGDVFRRVTIEVRARGEQQFKIVATLGRQYGGDVFKLLANTTLRPGERRLVPIDAPRPFDYRIIYHFMSEHEKTNSRTRPVDRERVLTQGTIGDL